MAHTAEAHKQASKLPALARQATEASVFGAEDGSSSDELPFGVPRWRARALRSSEIWAWTSWTSLATRVATRHLAVV